MKAVAAVDLKKIIAKTKGLNNCARGSYWFIAQHRHFHAGAIPATANRVQALLDARINKRVIELVLAIVEQEKLQRMLNKRLIVRIAQRAPHQHRGAIADVAGNYLVGQQGLAKVPQHGIDGVREVEA